MRYRLYAIERLVNRTLVYVTLTLLLLAVYAAITIGLGVVVGGDSAWVVALATLVVALVFRPMRARIQDLVDRRYRRARYEGVRRVRAFEDEVRDGARAPEDRRRARRRVAGSARGDVLLDPRVRRVRRHDRRPAGRAPARRASSSRDQRDDTPRPSCSTIRRWSSDAISSTAFSPPPLSRSRWPGCGSRSNLQLAEVQASRARIVEAGYEERRRLERDLHDGAQQRLVSLGVQVRRLQLSLPRAPP